VVEAKPKALLPVTLRNVEPAVFARSFGVLGGEENADPPSPVRQEEDVAARLRGGIFRVPPDRAGQMLDWIKKISRRSWEDREKSIFGPVTAAKAKSFTVPKLHGPKAFEVVGIPLPKPGFYVVEIESEILGAALLGAAKPMFVPAAVLATNLSVHLERCYLTAASLIDDSPVDLPVAGGVYRPMNYDQQFHGLVTARAALASSLNVPAVKALNMIGLEALVERLRALGFRKLRSTEFYGPSLALGSADVSLWELVNAFRLPMPAASPRCA
jgi:hypothetical protein